MTLPPRVSRCTTHYEACECREWHHMQSIAALRAVLTLAYFIGSRNHDQEDIRKNIMDRSKEVLDAFREVKE